MYRPTDEQMKAMGVIATQQPAFLEWLGAWRYHELSALPKVSENTAIAQGRCQVLGELYTTLEKSTDSV